MLAQYFAQQSKCVLAVDLDLESPGLGALAQKDTDLSEHGLVDHLVEAAVDNAEGLELVSRSQLITGNHNDEVWLAPAAGRRRQGYLAKLNRIYSDLPGRGFGARLEDALSACEAQVAELSRTPIHRPGRATARCSSSGADFANPASSASTSRWCRL